MSTKLEPVFNKPDSIGFYWAKSGSYKWYNLIVEVHGESPFFRLRAWHLFDQTLTAIESWSIKEWGPKIEQPMGHQL
jgi:hypothetical protein